MTLPARSIEPACVVCAGLGVTLYHGTGETAEVRSCSQCGTGLPIAPSEVPNAIDHDADTADD